MELNANLPPLPPFNASDIQAWFLALEMIFETCGEMNELKRFSHVIGLLPYEATIMVRDIIMNYKLIPDPYNQMRDELCRKLGKGKHENIANALTEVIIGKQRPSCFVDSINRSLSGCTLEDIKMYLLMQALPTCLQQETLRSLMKGESVRNVAWRLDNMFDSKGKEYK